MSTTMRSKAVKGVAAVAAVAALAFGANAVTHGGSSSSTAAAQGRGGARPQMGTAVTGSTLTKLKRVATDRYSGTVHRAMKLSDGSYVVEVTRSGGTQVHVLVSKDFKVTGTQKGGPPGGSGGAPDGSGGPPSGSPPSSSSASSST